MIGAMVDDVMAETERRAHAAKVGSADDVRALGRALVAFSPAMFEDLSRLREFLFERMYRHWRVNRTRSQARRILAEMFQLFLAEPDVLPAELGRQGDGGGRGGPRADRLRLHRRHDRPLRHRGAPQAVPA